MKELSRRQVISLRTSVKEEDWAKKTVVSEGDLPERTAPPSAEERRTRRPQTGLSRYHSVSPPAAALVSWPPLTL